MNCREIETCEERGIVRSPTHRRYRSESDPFSYDGPESRRNSVEAEPAHSVSKFNGPSRVYHTPEAQAHYPTVFPFRASHWSSAALRRR